MNGKGSRRDSSAAVADSLIADLESEFDLMRLQRYMAVLEQKDDRLAGEINALKAGIAIPGRTPEYTLGYTAPPYASFVRRWARTLAAEGRILLLEARRRRLADEWRRCSAVASDIRFGLRVTGSPRR